MNFLYEIPISSILCGISTLVLSASMLFFRPSLSLNAYFDTSPARTQPFGGTTGQASATKPAKTDDVDANADADEDEDEDAEGEDTDQESTGASPSSDDGKEAPSASSRDAAQIQRDRQLGIVQIAPSSQASAASQNAPPQPAQPKKAPSSKIKACRARRRIKF